MVIKNNIFEDLARVSNSVASVAFESAKNIKDSARSKAHSIAKSADLITRDEFEAFKQMAIKARTDTENLIKEFADIKKQTQHITSTIDVLKEQVGKGGNGGNGEQYQKIFGELQSFSDFIEKKINDFESQLSEVKEKFNSSKEDKSHSKGKKSSTSNNNLFSDEQA